MNKSQAIPLPAQSRVLRRQPVVAPGWAESLDLGTIPVNKVVEIRRFEYNSGDPELDAQKFILLERLAARKNTQITVIMTVRPSSEDYGRMFPSFEVVDLREEPLYWKKLYKGPAEDFIWKECGPMAALWPIGAQLAEDIKAEDIKMEKFTQRKQLLPRSWSLVMDITDWFGKNARMTKSLRWLNWQRMGC